MKHIISVAALAAVLALAACDRGGADPAVETQPAGTQPAPTAQHQAAPQTGANTPSAEAAQAPAPGAESYAQCMDGARGAPEGEREVRQRACAGLAGAPKP